MDTLFKTTTLLLYILYLLYIYASVFIFFYAILTSRDLDHNPIFRIKIFNTYFFSIGCIIGLTVFFAAGFEKALFFIPESWGSLSEDFSYIFAFVTSIGFLVKADKIFLRKDRK